MMRAADQDWYEQGDIWAQLAAHRTASTSRGPAPATQAAVRQLLTAAGDASDSPLTSAPTWPAAFEHAGQALARLAQQGGLTRGLRAVLAHHLLFSFNRLGIPGQHQHLLATAAARAIFGPDTAPGPAQANGRSQPHAPAVTAVSSHRAGPPACAPEQLREDLIAFIDGLGTFRTPQVRNAFRAVPRHAFLPGVDLATAYAPRPVVTRRAADGTAISSASSPNIVAVMLEQLDVQPGHRVLEIGTATGINAALLAELTGPAGTVVTIELDRDLAGSARERLTANGYPHVTVTSGDGALGHPSLAPYDRIIITAGAWDLAPAWWQQLAPGGRLVVPLRLHASGLTRTIAFDLREPRHMVSSSAAVCGFVPIRGTTEAGEQHITLASDIIFKLDTGDLDDPDALARALTYPAREHWTGIRVRHDDPAEHLDLWLATTGASSFGRISVAPSAGTAGLARPAVRWAGAALHDSQTIAYLTTRPCGDDTDELGIIAHGPGNRPLTTTATDLLHYWNRQRPGQPRICARPTDGPGDEPASAARIARPSTQLTITW